MGCARRRARGASDTASAPRLRLGAGAGAGLLRRALFAKSTRGFGTDSVSGRRRVPKPPTRMRPFIVPDAGFWKVRAGLGRTGTE